MGWGRWLVLGDIGQQLDIEEQRAEADILRRRLIASHSGVRSAERQLKQLQNDVDELKIYLASMLKLLTAKGVVTPDDVKTLVSSIDDGKAAKEKARNAPAAPPTRRPLPRRYPRA